MILRIVSLRFSEGIPEYAAFNRQAKKPEVEEG
jgi:hypothetical protein